jgi:hypothetical protein
VTLKLFKEMMDTESDNAEEILSLLENAWNDRVVSMLEYAQVKSDINMQYDQLESNTSASQRVFYTGDEK